MNRGFRVSKRIAPSIDRGYERPGGPILLTRSLGKLKDECYFATVDGAGYGRARFYHEDTKIEVRSIASSFLLFDFVVLDCRGLRVPVVSLVAANGSHKAASGQTPEVRLAAQRTAIADCPLLQ